MSDAEVDREIEREMRQIGGFAYGIYRTEFDYARKLERINKALFRIAGFQFALLALSVVLHFLAVAQMGESP